MRSCKRTGKKSDTKHTHSKALQRILACLERLNIIFLWYKTRYLAATGVQDTSLQMQLRCDAYFKQVEDNNVPSGGTEAFEHDIVELFLTLLNEAKYLKERISQITNEPYDLSQIEIYGKYPFICFVPVLMTKYSGLSEIALHFSIKCFLGV